jgi:hypothetical protein
MIKAALLFVPLIFAAQLAMAQANVNRIRQDLFREGYQSWAWQQSSCMDCDIILISAKSELHTPKVQAFIRALESSKGEILSLYGSNPQEYNLLAQMAVGILGRESKFFESRRYQFKEDFPWAVSILKTVNMYLAGADSATANSRGPTQIKVVPQRIAAKYGITPDKLYIPENAARATMGFLIEALGELKQRAQNNDWEFVTPETYADYLPYIYFGATGKLRNRTATPETNLYIREMKQYMGWLEMYERPIQRLNP